MGFLKRPKNQATFPLGLDYVHVRCLSHFSIDWNHILDRLHNRIPHPAVRDRPFASDRCRTERFRNSSINRMAAFYNDVSDIADINHGSFKNSRVGRYI